MPDDNKGWRPYTFDKELAQLQAKYAVPDSENAAVIYNQILENWKQKEANEPNLPNCWFDNVRKGPWLNKDQPEIAAYIKYHQNEIESVLQATKIEKCSFPIASSFFMYIGHLPAIRQGAYLLIAIGNNDIAEGNTKEAVEKYLAAIRLGQHACQQPEYTYNLVGFACEALGLGAINNFVVLGDANEFYLDKLEQAVSAIRYDWNTDLPDFINLDKLRIKNTFGGSIYEVNLKGKTRISRDQYAKIREELKKQLDEGTIDDPETRAELQKNIICPGYWQRILMKAYAIPSWFFVPTTPEKYSGIVDASFEKLYKMTDHDFDWSKEPNDVPIESLFQLKLNLRYFIELTSQMNEKMYFGLHGFYLQSSARQKGTLLIIGMRRYKNAHGHWPEKLEDINNLAPAEAFIDPVNCGPFVYRCTGDSFMLYSRGKNNIDEDGEHETKDIKNYPYMETIKDDEMIWPYKSKSSIQQEVKADVNEGAIK
ncbi:MAG: hypothetical protein ABSB91_04115 [Sedimentisphaerales bacterium]